MKAKIRINDMTAWNLATLNAVNGLVGTVEKFDKNYGLSEHDPRYLVRFDDPPRHPHMAGTILGAFWFKPSEIVFLAEGGET